MRNPQVMHSEALKGSYPGPIGVACVDIAMARLWWSLLCASGLSVVIVRSRMVLEAFQEPAIRATSFDKRNLESPNFTSV